MEKRNQGQLTYRHSYNAFACEYIYMVLCLVYGAYVLWIFLPSAAYRLRCAFPWHGIGPAYAKICYTVSVGPNLVVRLFHNMVVAKFNF